MSRSGSRGRHRKEPEVTLPLRSLIGVLAVFGAFFGTLWFLIWAIYYNK